MKQVVVGTVGYYQFLRGYPLGPELMERLQAVPWPVGVSIREMNWGPIAIVQDFQASSVTYDRVVLVASVDRGAQLGSVTCRRWLGGHIDTLAVQARVYEAVTGIISLDNLLVIGEHFRIWPSEVLTVEVQLPDSSFGNFVLAGIEVDREAAQAGIIGENPTIGNVKHIVERIVGLTRCAAIDDVNGIPEMVPLTIEQLRPVATVCQNQFIDSCQPPTVRH